MYLKMIFPQELQVEHGLEHLYFESLLLFKFAD